VPLAVHHKVVIEKEIVLSSLLKSAPKWTIMVESKAMCEAQEREVCNGTT
jgi:hypothetical protein